MSRVSFDQLIEAGAHFGHLTRKWNAAMAPYIFMERNDIHIIDLHKTVVKVDEAAEIAKAMAKGGKKILFVATKKQLKGAVAELAKAVKKMGDIDKMTADGTFDNLSKREKLQISRQRAKLELTLGSIADMRRLPSALFVVDVMKEHIAVAEAKRLGIPVFAIVDTNSDPSNIDYVIPANDDSAAAVEIIVSAVCVAISEGLQERKAEGKGDEKDENEEGVKRIEHGRSRNGAARRPRKAAASSETEVEAEA